MSFTYRDRIAFFASLFPPTVKRPRSPRPHLRFQLATAIIADNSIFVPSTSSDKHIGFTIALNGATKISRITA